MPATPAPRGPTAGGTRHGHGHHHGNGVSNRSDVTKRMEMWQRNTRKRELMKLKQALTSGRRDSKHGGVGRSPEKYGGEKRGDAIMGQRPHDHHGKGRSHGKCEHHRFAVEKGPGDPARPRADPKGTGKRACVVLVVVIVIAALICAAGIAVAIMYFKSWGPFTTLATASSTASLQTNATKVTATPVNTITNTPTSAVVTTGPLTTGTKTTTTSSSTTTAMATSTTTSEIATTIETSATFTTVKFSSTPETTTMSTLAPTTVAQTSTTAVIVTTTSL